jgi:nitrite reductase (NO-forming)
MVVHEGDYVEVTPVNPAANTMPHNIDFHAATGAMGGGDLTLISPGEQTVLRWKVTRTGVFVYHCIPGGDMIPWHIASGGCCRQAVALRSCVLRRRKRFLRSARQGRQVHDL